MTITRRQLLEMHKSIQGLGNTPGSKKYYNALYKNLNAIEKVFEPLNKITIPTQAIIDFEKEKLSIRMNIGSFDFGSSNNKIQKAIKNLEKSSKQAREDIDILRGKTDDLLDEEIEIDLIQIGIQEMPGNLTPYLREVLDPIILDEPEQKLIEVSRMRVV